MWKVEISGKTLWKVKIENWSGKWKLGVKGIKLYIFIHICIQYCSEMTIVSMISSKWLSSQLYMKMGMELNRYRFVKLLITILVTVWYSSEVIDPSGLQLNTMYNNLLTFNSPLMARVFAHTWRHTSVTSHSWWTNPSTYETQKCQICEHRISEKIIWIFREEYPCFNNFKTRIAHPLNKKSSYFKQTRA